MKRIRRTPEEARRLILSAAQELVAATGPEGLRLQEIAARAGISHSLILHHFGSREGLVAALTQEAAIELRDRLLATMTSGGFGLEAQLDRVFDAFRDGLAQRLAWLATIEPEGQAAATAMIMRQIADVVHSRREAAAAPGTTVRRSDTEWLLHLVAAAAFGDAIFGSRLRRSAGLPVTAETDRQFRDWLANLIREHDARAEGKTAS